MSLDFSVVYPACESCGHPDIVVRGEGWNYTYNVSNMCVEAARAIGFEDERMLECLEGPCDRAYERIDKLIAELLGNRPKYMAMNPSNGWGSMDGIVSALRDLQLTCMGYRSATLVACR